MNWLKDILFYLKTGNTTRTLNNGNPVDEVVIRYKDYYLGIMVDVASGKPTGDLFWSNSPSMFDVPVREHYRAER